MEGYIKIGDVPKKCESCTLCVPLPNATGMWYCARARRGVQPQKSGRPKYCPIETKAQDTDALKAAIEAAKEQFCLESDCTDTYEREHMVNLKYHAMHCVLRMLQEDDAAAALAEFKEEAKELDKEYGYGLFC